MKKPGTVKKNGNLCAACGQSFGGLTDFDKHQKWTYRQRERSIVVCTPAADMGMVLNAAGVWIREPVWLPPTPTTQEA